MSQIYGETQELLISSPKPISSPRKPISSPKLISSPGKVARSRSHWIFRYRIVESLLFLILNYLAWNGNFDISKTHEIRPPSVSVSMDGVQIDVTDPAHAFPLKVDGKWCYASDFQNCAANYDVNRCCHGHYEETIDSTGEKQIFYLIPSIFLVVRHFVLRFGLKIKDAGYTFGHHFVGLLACWFFVYLGTDLVKSFVGYPRPNFYALKAYGELHDSSDAIEKGYVSFPSGHAATSMSTMLYISLTQIYDLKLISLRKNIHDSVGWRGLFCFMPIFFSIWVGSTRIVDYFHAPADVLAGFFLGGIAGVIAIMNFVPDFVTLELKNMILKQQTQGKKERKKEERKKFILSKVYGSGSNEFLEQGIYQPDQQNRERKKEERKNFILSKVYGSDANGFIEQGINQQALSS